MQIEKWGEQMDIFDLGIWCMKTCQDSSAQMPVMTSDVSLKKSPRLLKKTPLFLDLRGGQSGHHAESLWVTDLALLGQAMMPGTTVFPKEGEEYVYWLTSTENPHQRYVLNCSEKPLIEKPSKLSEILEANPNPKYNLSAKACQGILNRSERRGKQFPPVLREVLIHQAPLSRLGGGCERDSNGRKAGKGALIQEELSGTLGVSQDQTLICIEGNGSRESHRGDGFKVSDTMYTLNTVEQHAICISGDVAETLDSSYYKGCGERGGREREVVCQQRLTLSIGNGQVQEAITPNEECARTLNCMHDQQAIVTFGIDRASFNQGQNAQFNFSVDEEMAQTLVSKGPGGGTYQQTIGSLCACDYKGAGSQYVTDDKLIIQHYGRDDS